MARYTVQRGDTLSAIARRVGVPWRSLYDMNRQVIGSNPNMIRAGMVLELPGEEAAAKAPAPTGNPVLDEPALLNDYERRYRKLLAALELSQQQAAQDYEQTRRDAADKLARERRQMAEDSEREGLKRGGGYSSWRAAALRDRQARADEEYARSLARALQDLTRSRDSAALQRQALELDYLAAREMMNRKLQAQAQAQREKELKAAARSSRRSAPAAKTAKTTAGTARQPSQSVAARSSSLAANMLSAPRSPLYKRPVQPPPKEQPQGFWREWSRFGAF